MQELELLILAVGILVAVAYFAREFSQGNASNHPLARVLLGVIPAVIAVALILFNRVDVIPDDLEQGAFTVAIVMVTVGLILGTTYRLARH